jgi:D-aspartate ligase
MSSKDLNPVYILNLSYTGLGIARSFAGAGIEVFGIGSKKFAYGNFSRFVKFHLSPDSLDEPEELCEFLVSFSKKGTRKPVVFPTRDHDLIFLDRYRKRLEPHFILPLPPSDVLDRVLNKWRLFETANACDLPTPETYLIQDDKELELVRLSLHYPLVLKPIYAADWRKDGVWEAVGKRKAIYVESEDHLLEEYNAFKRVQPKVILQKYVEGEDQDIYTFCSYCDQESDVVVSFNTRKIIQAPERFGTGILVKSTISKEPSKLGRRLLKHLRFTGVSEIEYKRDPSTGTYYLIEVNPRFWDQHRLSRSWGINLPWITYNHLIERPVAPRPYGYSEMTWIAEDTYLDYRLRQLLRRKKPIRIQRSTKRIYAIWSLDDPGPSIIAVSSLVVSFMKGIIRMTIKRFQNRMLPTKER